MACLLLPWAGGSLWRDEVLCHLNIREDVRKYKSDEWTSGRIRKHWYQQRWAKIMWTFQDNLYRCKEMWHILRCQEGEDQSGWPYLKTRVPDSCMVQVRIYDGSRKPLSWASQTLLTYLTPTVLGRAVSLSTPSCLQVTGFRELKDLVKGSLTGVIRGKISGVSGIKVRTGEVLPFKQGTCSLPALLSAVRKPRDHRCIPSPHVLFPLLHRNSLLT